MPLFILFLKRSNDSGLIWTAILFFLWIYKFHALFIFIPWISLKLHVCVLLRFDILL